MLTKPLTDGRVWPKVIGAVQEAGIPTRDGFFMTFDPTIMYPDEWEAWFRGMFGPIELPDFGWCDSAASATVKVSRYAVYRVVNPEYLGPSPIDIDTFRSEVLPKVLPVYPALVEALESEGRHSIGSILDEDAPGVLRAIEAAKPSMRWAAGQLPCGFPPGSDSYLTLHPTITRSDSPEMDNTTLVEIEKSLPQPTTNQEDTTMDPLLPITHPDAWHRVVAAVREAGYVAADHHIVIKTGDIRPPKGSVRGWAEAMAGEIVEQNADIEEYEAFEITSEGGLTHLPLGAVTDPANSISIIEFTELVRDKVFRAPDLATTIHEKLGGGSWCVAVETRDQLRMAMRIFDRCFPTLCWGSDAAERNIPPVSLTTVGRRSGARSNRIGLFVEEKIRSYNDLTWSAGGGLFAGEKTRGYYSLTWAESDFPIDTEATTVISVISLVSMVSSSVDMPTEEPFVEAMIPQSLPETGVKYVDLRLVEPAQVRGLFHMLGEGGFVWQGTGEALAATDRHTRKQGLLLDFDAKTAAYIVDTAQTGSAYAEWRVRWEKAERRMPFGDLEMQRAVIEGRVFETADGMAIDANTAIDALRLLDDYRTQRAVGLVETTPWVINTGYGVHEAFLATRGEVLALVTDNPADRVELPMDRPDNPLAYLRDRFPGDENRWARQLLGQSDLVRYTPEHTTYPYVTGATTWKYADPIPAWVLDLLKSYTTGV